MMVLVAVAIGVGWLYSVAATFFIEGEVFYEAAAMLATLRAARPLVRDARPRRRQRCRSARCSTSRRRRPSCIRDGEPVEVPTAEVQVGDLLLIRPGAKVPVDAEVEEGESRGRRVDGHRREPARARRRRATQLIGATINKNGTLRARATAVGSDTALAQIVKLVQEAQNSKAPGQRLADRAAFWLVLVALVGGTLTFVVWYFIVGRDVQDALLFAITVVVITCPDALGLATPTAIMVGTGLGAKRGILFKHAMALEQAATLDTVVLDKTGTLTRGEPEVVAVATADGVERGRGAAPRRGRRAATASTRWRRRSSTRPRERGLDARRAPSPSRPCPATARSRPSTASGSPSATQRLLDREGIALDGLAAPRRRARRRGPDHRAASRSTAQAAGRHRDRRRAARDRGRRDQRAQGARRAPGDAVRRQPRDRRTGRRASSASTR